MRHPRSSNTPCNSPSTPAVRTSSLEPRERPPDERETWLVTEPQPPRPDGLWIAIDRHHATVRTQCVEDRGGMPATTERRVAVASVSADRQPRQHFLEEYRRVPLHVPPYSESCTSSVGRSPASSPAASHASRRSFQCCSSQSSNLLPCPINIA